MILTADELYLVPDGTDELAAELIYAKAYAAGGAILERDTSEQRPGWWVVWWDGDDYDSELGTIQVPIDVGADPLQATQAAVIFLRGLGSSGLSS